ncbi:chemotaxis response regulator protein-glutamate methylesterase [Halalkalibacterium halodurans]|uniref:protein-glutamate methylesterase/protein-glutamine glutaminase n=1 Tax=Halalkalibacterium halodurans TaxID=86665 RepID=UPI002E1E68C6|nr:chemotaxis response regulator protein-glutamate methylesterase [Halalkalibacterium halodurans]
MESRIKVLVVDDSAFMRKVITSMLESDPRLEVVGTARNGEDALKKRKTLAPDVMTLDVEMPVMDGIETLKRLMSENPLPIIIVSSTTKEGAENALTAMELGAVDFITKPSGPISLDLEKVRDLLIEKVASAPNVKLKPTSKKLPVVFRPLQQPVPFDKTIIVIGTSTGGPKALKQVLTKLPKDLPAPILIVQHMPAGFTESLANRLNSLCEIHVKEAEDGEIIRPGVAYIAPGGYHLETKRLGTSIALHLTKEEPRKGHRPSVDVLFESVSALSSIYKVAVIMTGMGSDGTEGLEQLKRGSCYAIAESEQSCVVFGMPKVAIERKLVDEVTHLELIADSIVRQCKR